MFVLNRFMYVPGRFMSVLDRMADRFLYVLDRFISVLVG